MSTRDEAQEVLHWLREKGFPLELRAGRAFRASGWHVSHASPYRDPLTEKVRELDISAKVDRWQRDPDAGLAFEFHVECKDNVDRPCVVLTTEKPRPVVGLECVPGGVPQEFMLRGPFPDLARAGFPTDLLGFGMVQKPKGRKDQDLAYEALTMAVGSSIARCRANENGLLLDTPLVSSGIILPVPVVVLSGNLYRYSIAADGSEAFDGIDRAMVMVNHPAGDHVATIVVTELALPAFAKQAYEVLGEFCDKRLLAVPDVVEAFRRRRSSPTSGPAELYLPPHGLKGLLRAWAAVQRGSGYRGDSQECNQASDAVEEDAAVRGKVRLVYNPEQEEEEFSVSMDSRTARITSGTTTDITLGPFKTAALPVRSSPPEPAR